MKKGLLAAVCLLLTGLLLTCCVIRAEAPVRPTPPAPEEPEQPEEPEEPEQPEQPEQPEEPEEPEQPEQPEEPEQPEQPEQPEEPEQPDTAEEFLAQMTLREKVGQVIWIIPEQLDPDMSDRNIAGKNIARVTEITDEMVKTLEQYPAGGFVLFAGNIDTPDQLKAMTGRLRDTCAVTPVVTVDEEGGRVARIAGNPNFDVPRVDSMEALAAGGDPARVRTAAAQIGAYLAALGFNMDLAPVADMNTNPRNVVIGDRAFGSDPDAVAPMVRAYLEGLHSRGVKGVLKHFPGHGDTEADSHHGTVTVTKTWEELLSSELVPFIRNLDAADAVMVAHITLPNVTSDGLPASLSRELIQGRLRQELGYNGLILSDSLSMGAIDEHYSAGRAAVLAFEAGNDVVLMPGNYVEAFESLLSAVESGEISRARLDESVLRVLRMKLGQ